MSDSSIFIEKYRPKNFSEMILTTELTKFFSSCIENKTIPHLLLYGRAGIGKTSIGKVIAKEIGAPLLYINGSKEKTIDVLRDTIYRFASTYSDESLFNDNPVHKIVFIDECEKITFQESLKVILEETQENCRFVLATNNISAIIDPIRNERCQTFNLEPTNQEERVELSKKYAMRLVDILKTEGISYDTRCLIKVIKRTFPSFRKAISTVHKTYLTYGSVNSDVEFDDLISSDLIDLINKKDVLGIRKYVSNIDPLQFFREFYETFDKHIDEKELLHIASLYGEYAWRNSRHDDREANLFAFLIALAQNCKLKK